MRKAVAITLALVLTLSVAGCGKILESQYSSSNDHHQQSSGDHADADMTLDAADYGQLYDAVTAFVAGGVEHGIVRMASYDGDMEADLAQAVTTASNATPLGAYCAYYINYSIVRLVSVYEAHVSIIYRHTPEEAESAVRCADNAELEELMLRALLKRTGKVTLYVTDEGLNEQAVTSAVELAYYENPGDILYIPSCTVTSYPETGPERILEVELAFSYAASTVETRHTSMLRRVRDVTALVSGESAQEKLTALADYFRENVTFDQSVDPSDAQARRYNAMTAYGALVQGRAVGEGYAMAMKVLCDKLGLECHVIRGRLNNLDHAWNLVRLENGALYHMDVSQYVGGGAVYRNDEQQIYNNYSWDASQYPECAGESLYGPEYNPSKPDDEPPSDKPDTPSDEPPQPSEEPSAGEQTPEDPTETGGSPDPGTEPPDDPGEENPAETS